MTLPNTIVMTETLYSNGLPVPNVEVTLQLVASNVDPNQPGYAVADAYTIGDKIVTHSNALGAWSADLEPNSIVTPANTRWKISYRFPKAGYTKLPVYVLAQLTPATQRVEDSLTDGPDGLAASVVSILTRQRPLPVGASDIAIGDSITAGAGSALSNSTNNGDSRQAVGGWFSRLAGQHPDRYLKVRNAGIGGDITGGLGKLTERAEAGTFALTYRLDYGNQAYNTGIGVYVDGYSSTSDVGLPTGNSTDNGDGTWTVTLDTAMTVDHEIGEEVGWGIHGRLQANVIDWAPDIVHVACGTNDSALVYVTAAQVARAIVEVGQRLRDAGIEPIFHELLPRSSFMDNVASINDALQELCKTGGTQGAYHLVPLYHHFAGGDGKFASATYHDGSGLHPSDLGHQKYADVVHTYLSLVGLRVANTRLAPYDTATINEVDNACFLTSASGGGGQVPTGWSLSQFFTTLTVPGIEAPAAGDGITGQWATLTASTGAAGSTSLQQTLRTFTVGDQLYIAARVKVTGVEAGFKATVQFLTGTFTLDLGYQISDNMDMTLVCCSATLSSVSQSIFNMNVAPSGHAGKLMVAQPLVQNLTQLERAA